MKNILLFIFICLAGSRVMAQHIYPIRADSVRIYSNCDTAELIIENRTKDTLGFLYNKGKGRTEFRKLRLQAINGNSIAIVGQDTLKLNTIIRTAVDTIYTSGNILSYRKTDGTVVNVTLDLSTWGDSRYDLLSTNYKTIPAGSSMTYDQWPGHKVVGYEAYNVTDMPTLSDQAFQGKGTKTYYNGLMFKGSNTSSGFDIAINWDGEEKGPNGMFVRTRDDTQDPWSNWRELLFKDYADKKYNTKKVADTVTTGAGWYRIALNGPLVAGSTIGGDRAYGRFIITEALSGLHQTVEFVASVNFNDQPILKILSNSNFSVDFPFMAIRLVKREGGTYDGNAIEVLTNRPEKLNVKAVMLDNEQTSGWTMLNWQKITSSTGINDGLPAGFTQSNFYLNKGIVEATGDENGNYWQYVRGKGLQTNAGFRHRNYLGMVGDYNTSPNTPKIIWTVGDDWDKLNNYYGIGYDYGNQAGFGNDDHQFVITFNGNPTHRFNLNGGVSLTGPLKVTGNITAPGFYQSSLRSLKKDIIQFNGDAIQLINNLKIIEFTYKDDKEENRHVGIIADESDAHFSTKQHDKFDINSSLSITMKAIQELTLKLEELNKRMDEIEKKIE
jgi:hypothetical protein